MPVLIGRVVSNLNGLWSPGRWSNLGPAGILKSARGWYDFMMKPLLLGLFAAILAVFAHVEAQAKSVQRVRIAVKADVFAEPSFNSKVVEKLKPRALISMSTAKVIGTGGLGVFYKVKTPGGKIGYIADTDLVALAPEEKTETPPVKEADDSREPKPKAAKEKPAEEKPVSQTSEEEAEKEPPPPSARTPFWGLSVSSIDYTEQLAGRAYHKSQLFFGIRRNQLRRARFGLGSDANLLVSPMAPQFLADAGGSGITSGMIIMLDYQLNVALGSGALVPYLGLGPSVVYSSFQTNLNGASYSSSNTYVGGVVDLGLDYDFGGQGLRAELRYFVGSSSYLGFGASWQIKF